MSNNTILGNWIDSDILACQRPSNRLIEKYKILDQFVDKGITSIFNLQQPGEHPWCGDGLAPSGFSYDPELFMTRQSKSYFMVHAPTEPCGSVSFYNFGWKDMKTPSFERMLDIVKVYTSFSEEVECELLTWKVGCIPL